MSEDIRNNRKLVVISGAGMSAESGLKTFRDAGGLWEGYDIMEVASPEGWRKDRDTVLRFYNLRRAQLKEVKPNPAHEALAKLEKHFDVHIVTQNVDNLHERAGSNKVLHLHGELTKVRSTGDPRLIYNWEGDLNPGDCCDQGFQLRPHIVWFGEPVPAFESAVNIVSQADIVAIIGTSLQVYPAASLIAYCNAERIFYIDPKPSVNYELGRTSYQIIKKNAVEGVLMMTKLLLSDMKHYD